MTFQFQAEPEDQLLEIPKVKVLHVIASVDPRGGGPIEGVISSSLVWSRHGHERHILTLDSPDVPWLKDVGVVTFAIGPKGHIYNFLRRNIPWLRYGYTPRLKTWLKQHASEYDAVIINGLWNFCSYGTWRGLRTCKVPYFVFTHGMLDPWFAETYPIKHLFKSFFWNLFERKVLRDARGTFFTSDEEMKLASLSFRPYQSKGYVVGYGTKDVPPPASTQYEAFYNRVPEVRGRKTILFLSRIHRKKGIDLLIKAFASLANMFPEFDLVIAGPDQGGWKQRMVAVANECEVTDRIYWPGMLTGEEKWGAFRAATFFVLPSHQENFGIAVAEALALATPVLITDKVNIWREIEADGAGLVVSDDAKSIADAMHTLCSMPEKDRETMGLRARQCFLTRYDQETNAMALLTQIEKLKNDASE